MSEWQPIETAPRDETEVLLFCEGGIVVGWFIDGLWMAAGGEVVGEYCGEPTHWMPLPDPPKD